MYKYHVMIYDSLGSLILDCFTVNGKLLFEVPKDGVYKIIVVPPIMYNTKCLNVIIGGNSCKILLFSFERNNNKTVTLTLTDRNYQGLPIKKGGIFLCKIHT